MLAKEHTRTVLVVVALASSFAQGCFGDSSEAGDSSALGDATPVDATSSPDSGSKDDEATPEPQDAVDSGSEVNPTPDGSGRDRSSFDVDARGDEDASSDADGPAPDSEASTCPRSTVWPTGSSRLWLSIAADRVLYDSSCAYSDNYEFSLFEKTLANRGCPAQAFDYLVHLTDEQVARLEAILTSVYNTCEKLCGFPHERASITVRNETTGAQATFNRNFDFFHDCSESGVGNPFPPGPPFIGFSDFSELQTALAQIIAEACRPGDSGPPDAGRCVNRSDGGSEAGPSDAAAQAPEGDATLDHAGDLGMTTPVADTQIILYDNVVVASERTGCKVP